MTKTILMKAIISYNDFLKLAEQNNFTTIEAELTYWLKEKKLTIPKDLEPLLEIAWREIDSLMDNEIENWLNMKHYNFYAIVLIK